ncbi:MAG: hypothetical protein ACWA5U_04315 [bacterium]
MNSIKKIRINFLLIILISGNLTTIFIANKAYANTGLINGLAPAILSPGRDPSKNYLPDPLLLSGAGAEPNSISLIVTLIDQYGNTTPANYATINANGSWTTEAIQGIHELADGSITIRIIETDWLGNTGMAIEQGGIEKDYILDIDFFENSTEPVTDIDTADNNDSENNGLSYQLTGIDAAEFTINSEGIIKFIMPPDYEHPMDANHDKIYEFNVVVQDSDGYTDTLPVRVSLKNKQGTRIHVRALLQGAWDSNTQLMRDSLRQKLLLPHTEPYTALGYQMSGCLDLEPALLAVEGADAVVDWIALEFRHSADPNSVVLSLPNLLQRDGDLMDPVSGETDIEIDSLPAGDYHLVLRHRNHLSIMTREPVTILNDEQLNYIDFSHPNTRTWGSHARRLYNEKAFLWSGDTNHDQQIIAIGTNNDLNPIREMVWTDTHNIENNPNYVLYNYAPTDLNLDGKIIQAGKDNDENTVHTSLLLHPNNPSKNLNYMLKAQLPELEQ